MPEDLLFSHVVTAFTSAKGKKYDSALCGRMFLFVLIWCHRFIGWQIPIGFSPGLALFPNSLSQSKELCKIGLELGKRLCLSSLKDFCVPAFFFNLKNAFHWS